MRNITIYTGCIGGVKKYPPEVMPITICLYPPKKGSIFVNYAPLAPTREMFYSSEWDRKFEKLLERRDARTVYRELAQMSGGRDVVLLCFERPGDRCHRHIVAKWLESQLGIEVNEILPGGEVGRCEHQGLAVAFEPEPPPPPKEEQLGFDW